MSDETNGFDQLTTSGPTPYELLLYAAKNTVAEFESFLLEIDPQKDLEVWENLEELRMAIALN